MSAYIPGTVVIATLTFNELGAAKRRPVVLIGDPDYWGRDKSALVCPLTTVVGRPEDVPVNWQAASLPRPSCVRPRPRTIAKARVEWQLGVLTEHDLAALKDALRKTLGLTQP